MIVPMYKGKWGIKESIIFRGINLFSLVRKVYGRVIMIELKLSHDLIGGWVRRGRGCVDQIFIMRQLRRRVNKIESCACP